MKIKKKKSETVYLSGAITKNPNFLKDFMTAESAVRKLGYEKIISPTCLSSLTLDYEQFMIICFAMIDAADEVAFLANWKRSSGARREYLYATSKRKKIMFLE